jgi:hypothetical protein
VRCENSAEDGVLRKNGTQPQLRRIYRAVPIVLRIVCDLLHLASSAVRSRAELAAENLFLRKPLALDVERQVRPRRADDATRIALVVLSSLIDWRRLLTVVTPDTLIR